MCKSLQLSQCLSCLLFSHHMDLRTLYHETLSLGFHMPHGPVSSVVRLPASSYHKTPEALHCLILRTVNQFCTLSKRGCIERKGSRACIGMKWVNGYPLGSCLLIPVFLLSLGYAELYFTIAAMAHRFKFELHETTQENIRAVRDRGLPFSKDGHWTVKAKVSKLANETSFERVLPSILWKLILMRWGSNVFGYCIWSRVSLLFFNRCQG